jgi:hypothetical protein
MERGNKSVNYDIVIAEYEALRTEILQRSNTQWNIFALQLTAAAVVFSFALSNSSHTEFLLILPVLSYALCARYVSQSAAVQKLGKYIRDVLEPKAQGQIHWETWNKAQPPVIRLRALDWINPLYFVFPGVAITSLAWVAPDVWAGQNISIGERILLVIIWFIGIAITALTFWLIDRIVRRHRLGLQYKSSTE